MTKGKPRIVYEGPCCKFCEGRIIKLAVGWVHANDFSAICGGNVIAAVHGQHRVWPVRKVK